ncbi:universal stress protein [Leifsonia poae]|uniref:universal stress protein n=1 Tax=Leifsonia poae TaxID=110933 RepID=UPI001CBD770A|nr:universal stress protein [Leifsonia poae]
MDVPLRAGPVLVGVYPGQDTAVVREAAHLAGSLGTPLLCAFVALDSYLTEWERSELRDAASLHPTDIDADDDRVALDLAGAIVQTLQGATLAEGWSLRLLAGDPAHALARVAAEADARLIVVGTHGRGAGHALEAWLSGSVAMSLSRDQLRPVVVVPVGRAERSSATLG